MLNELKISEEIFKKLYILLSHDIKNPINVISTNVAVLDTYNSLIQDNELNSEINDIIKDFKLSIDILNRIIQNMDQLFSLYFDKVVNKQEIEIGMLLKSIEMRLIPHSNENNIKLTINIPEPTLFISDPGLINGLIENLILTSLRYAPSGGYINLSTEILQDNQLIKFILIDNGNKINSISITNMFLPAGQWESKNAEGCRYGRGLALLVTKYIVDLLNGNISIINNDNNVQFDITLPVQYI